MPDQIFVVTCKKCKTLKPSTEFYPDKRHSTGLQSICRDCVNLWKREFNKTEKGKSLMRSAYPRRRIKQREYRKGKGREIISNALKKYYYANRDKIRARMALGYAVRTGKITRPSTCPLCGAEKPEAHHHLGYSKEHWFDVEWRCRACHGKE